MNDATREIGTNPITSLFTTVTNISVMKRQQLGMNLRQKVEIEMFRQLLRSLRCNGMVKCMKGYFQVVSIVR